MLYQRNLSSKSKMFTLQNTTPGVKQLKTHSRVLLKVGQATLESSKQLSKAGREGGKHSLVHHRAALAPPKNHQLHPVICFTEKDVVGPFEMREKIKSLMQNQAEFLGGSCTGAI